MNENGDAHDYKYNNNDNGLDETGRGGWNDPPQSRRRVRQKWDDLDDGRQYETEQDWGRALDDEDLLRRRRERLQVKRPPLTVDDVKAELRRLESSEQLAIVKLRLRELEEQRKARQRVMDEYDFGDEQDTFRNKEREWQRSKWNHEEKKFYSWFQQAQEGGGNELSKRRELPAALAGGSSCSQFNTLLQRFKPYSEYVRGIQDTELAYVTFVTSPEFVPPAAVLMHSIAVSGSQYARCICVTKDISDRDRQTLSMLAQIVEIEKIASPKYVDNVRYREVFTKLRIWQLGMFKRVVYIDTDVIVVNNMDDLFDVEEWGVPMDAENNRYSTGLMVVDPKDTTFDDMLAKLKTTTVSMELPDLLFLKDYFDSNKRKINIIPRWYQVYQEEFGSQYASYLTRRKQKITVFDPRIHGIHYPGAGKPWGGDTNYKLSKYKPKFCAWRDAEEFRYEPQFLWYLHHELMVVSLGSSKSSALFDYESGGGVIVLSEWSAKRKKAQEEERRSPYGGYSSPWQRTDDTPAPQDYKWVYKDGRWVKDGSSTPAPISSAPLGIAAWSPSSCRFTLSWDATLSAPNSSTWSGGAGGKETPVQPSLAPMTTSSVYSGRRNPYSKHNYRGGHDLQQLASGSADDSEDPEPAGTTPRRRRATDVPTRRMTVADDISDRPKSRRMKHRKVFDDDSITGREPEALSVETDPDVQEESAEIRPQRLRVRESTGVPRKRLVKETEGEATTVPRKKAQALRDDSSADSLAEDFNDRRGRQSEFVPPKRIRKPDSNVPGSRIRTLPPADDDLGDAVADLLPGSSKAPHTASTTGSPLSATPRSTKIHWFGLPEGADLPTQSPFAMIPAVTEVALDRQDVSSASIDFSRVPPFAAKLPQQWDGSNLEKYLWLITWCTKTKLHVRSDQECGKASHISQFSGGMCRTNFDGSFSVSPIFVSSSRPLTPDDDETPQTSRPQSTIASDDSSESVDLRRRSRRSKATWTPKKKTGATSEPEIGSKRAHARSVSTSFSVSEHNDDKLSRLKEMYLTVLPRAFREKHSVEGVAGVVFRANSVLTDYPARTKWFEAVIRCDPSLPANSVELEHNATDVLVETIQGKHDRLYTIRLRSRCACLGGCDSPSRFSSEYNATFRQWKQQVLRPSGDSIADRCARKSVASTARNARRLQAAAGCVSQCELNAATNRCEVSTAKWIAVAQRAAGWYCNCTHVGGSADKSYTLNECEAEAEAAGANVINFISSDEAPPSSPTPPQTSAATHRTTSSSDQRGCFYKKCLQGQLLRGRPSLANYKPSSSKDVHGFDVYFLNPFAAEKKEKTPETPTSEPTLPSTPRPTSRFWNW